MEYFSDKEIGPKTRATESISPSAWGGIVAIVQSLVSTGGFGEHFPEMCPDGAGPVGTDERAFALALCAEIPEIDWPLRTTEEKFYEQVPFSPDALVVLDFIQFGYAHVAKPVQGGYHSFFQHHHLSFDIEAGKTDFREKVNRIFSRNGIVYELLEDGNIIRIAPPGLREELASAEFQTGDKILDQMMFEARRKFLNPDQAIRKEAVERLWDAWERLKSIDDPSDKKKSITQLLNNASIEPQFRELLEKEARKLTEIGNSFHIRHSEVTQTAIQNPMHLDYLFHRLFSMIILLLKTRKSQ
jgi:hypothetical protein